MRHRLQVTAVRDDIDGLGHVSNLVYVRWVLEAAVSHSSVVGWDAIAYRTLGAAFVVRRHEIDYLAPVLLDERVELETWVEGWRAASSVRRTTLTRVHDGVVVARASTTWAFMALSTGRPLRIPSELRDAFAAGSPPQED